MTSGKSQTKRKAPDLDVPDPGEDPAERKRVLNVLAQRRYRQRKKAHLQELEAQAAKGDPEAAREDTLESYSASPEENTRETLQVVDKGAQPSVDRPGDQDEVPFEPSTYFQQMAFEDPQVYTTIVSDPGDDQVYPATTTSDGSFTTYDGGLAFPIDVECFWDTSVLLSSLPSTPLSSTTNSSSNGSTTWSLVVPAAYASPRPVLTDTGRQASPQPFVEDMHYSFPDEAHLEMAELTLLRGCMAIAKRLNIQELIWSLTSTSPFTEPAMALAQFNHLPVNLQPTLVQMTVPHHPIIDMLPWPSVRDRMITILSQPPEVRPPGASSPMALLEFVYDIEDSAEGVRISGSDPYSHRNWEVGEKVFKSWWWIFDKDIIRRSNELRASRGAPMLGRGSILGEVA